MNPSRVHAKSLEDESLQAAVQEELHWTPAIDAARIGVTVGGGVVTLVGEVDSYMQLLAAERAAFRVQGVTAVACEIRITRDSDGALDDTDIARSARDALAASTELPPDSVTVLLSDGTITLSGFVKWDYQRQAAADIVAHLRGIRKVDNLIDLLPRPSAADAEDRIRAAFQRDAALEADSIRVRMEGTTATLSGTVRTAAEKTQAGLSTWASPHVTVVHNELEIVPE